MQAPEAMSVLLLPTLLKEKAVSAALDRQGLGYSLRN